MGYIKVNSCFLSVFQGRKGAGAPVFSSLVGARNSGLKNPILIEYDEDGGLVIHPSDKKLDDITLYDVSISLDYQSTSTSVHRNAKTVLRKEEYSITFKDNSRMYGNLECTIMD